MNISSEKEDALSLNRARDLLTYDPLTGIFRWRNNYRIAGARNPNGYIRIRINGELYLAHRLAWFYSYGEWPCGCIDHIDRDKSNNILSNLRDTSHTENLLNSGVQRNNTSGHIGVYYNKSARKWRAELCKKHLGSFDTIEQAILAREIALADFFKALRS